MADLINLRGRGLWRLTFRPIRKTGRSANAQNCTRYFSPWSNRICRRIVTLTSKLTTYGDLLSDPQDSPGQPARCPLPPETTPRRL